MIQFAALSALQRAQKCIFNSVHACLPLNVKQTSGLRAGFKCAHLISACAVRLRRHGIASTSVFSCNCPRAFLLGFIPVKYLINIAACL